MLGKVVRKLVTLPTRVLRPVCDLLEKLSDEVWVEALKRFLRKENPWLATPEDLMQTLHDQVNVLVEIGAHYELGMGENAYYRQCLELARNFKWSRELAKIGLWDVAVIDPRLTEEFLVDKAGVVCEADVGDFSNYLSVTTPDSPYVVQYQPGPKYRSHVSRRVRDNFPDSERGMTVSEALHWVLYQDELQARLRKCFLELLGSVDSNDQIPALFLLDKKLVLNSFSGDSKSSSFGAATVGIS